MATLPNFRTMTGTAGGGNPYGTVPSQVAMPRSVYSQIGDIAPALPKLTDTTTGVIQSELEGKLSPGTQNFLQQKAAEFGVGMGMPGMAPGSFNASNLVHSLGLTSEALSQQGVHDFGSFLGEVGQTQLNPQLEYEQALQNSIFAAAPDPAAAANKQLEILKEMYGRGSSAGGTGDYYPWATIRPPVTTHIPGKAGGGAGD